MQRTMLRGSSALALLMMLGLPAFAQTTPPPTTEDEELVDLGTLTLTAGKRDIATGSAEAITVVDQEEIEDRQGSTIAQLVDSVPGVTLVNGSTPQGSGINIRGFGANNTFGSDQKIAIIIDGATSGSEELYRIGTQLFTDPFLYKNIEVIRGTIGSFEYGSGIVGGVIQLETKDASDFTGGIPGVKIAQTLEYQSNGDGIASSTILAWQVDEQTEFLFNYAWRDQNDQEDGNGVRIGNSAFRTPSGLIKGKYSFGDALEHSLTFSYTNTVADDKDVPYDTFITTTDAFGRVDRTYDTTQVSLRYQYDPVDNDLIDFEATLSYADQEIEQSYVAGSSSLENTPTFAFLLPLVEADHRYETTKLTLKNTSLFETGGVSHELRSGIEFIRKERKDASSAPGGRDNRIALFLIDEMKVGGFTFTPAIRYETSDLLGDNGVNVETDAVMGGVSLAYEWTNGFAVFGSAAYTEGLPIIDDIAFTDFRRDTSEKSRTYEIGFSYAGTDVLTAGDTLALRAGYYDTFLYDVTSYSGVSSVEVSGFELEASYGLENGLYFDVNAHIGDGTEFLTAGGSDKWRNTPADRIALTVGKKW
ncbi:MAG: TonB-dependent receptor plug domain-containing protein, partial [Pseudomonadota bacterium]